MCIEKKKDIESFMAQYPAVLIVCTHPEKAPVKTTEK